MPFKKGRHKKRISRLSGAGKITKKMGIMAKRW